MFISNTWNVRNTLSTVLAAAIVGVSGLALDRGHIAAAPDGTVEVGQLMPVDALPGIATLAEVVVSAPALRDDRRRAGRDAMPHPIHDVLLRWLGIEQSAFDADSTVPTNYWPSERLPHDSGYRRYG